MRPRDQQRYACDSPRHAGRHERDLESTGPGRHQHVEGSQQMSFGPCVASDADLPKNVLLQPSSLMSPHSTIRSIQSPRREPAPCPARARP